MSLITCPECGGKVSTTADACPHCGWRLDKARAATKARLEKEKESWPSPIDSSWTKKWFRRLSITKLVPFLITVALVGLAIPFAIQSMAICIPLFIFAAFFFLFALGIALEGRVAVREYDGYTILVYAGFTNRLIVEGRTQAKGVFTRYMNGQLPNRVPVRVGITAWGNIVKIDIGNEHTFR